MCACFSVCFVAKFPNIQFRHADYGDETKKRSSHEHSCTKKARQDAHCNDTKLLKSPYLFISPIEVVYMFQDCLDNFKDQKEFWYVSKDANESEKGVQRNDKWWLPTVKVPPGGLSEESRKWMQKQKDCANQVLKASMAINAEVLGEMEIPENYIETLPKVYI